MSNEGSCLFWDLAETLCVGRKLPRTATIFPGPHSVVDVVKGIVPLEWVNTLCSVGLSLAQAKSVARKVGSRIVTAAYKDIWRPRCDAQVLRERSLLVTPKAKSRGRVRAVLPPHRTSIRSRLTHTSHALAGNCPRCQLSLADHLRGACPPLLSQAPYIADSMLQMYHRSLCSLPSIVNPRVALQVLDSIGGVVTEP